MKKHFITAIRSLGKPTMLLVRVVKVPTTHLALHLFGEQHTIYHRAATGLVIGALGIALPIPFHEGTMIYRVMEGLGTSIHAVGIVPFIDLIALKVRLMEQKAKEQIEELTQEVTTEKVTS